jgi:CHAT domain-containing protein/tetratricopeptide (TPR) repeat protein
MLARLAIVLVALASACVQTPNRRLQDLYEQGQDAIRRGEFAEAIKLSDTGTTRAGRAESSWSWRFRLLAAEAQILNRDFAIAEPAITGAVPLDRQFDSIRARQQFLRAKMNVSKGDLQSAKQALAEARRLASGDRDVGLDIDELDGQVLMRRGEWNEGETRLTHVVDAAGASDLFRQAMALNDLGMSRLVRSQYDSALMYFERVVALDQLRDYSIWAAALKNAGSCYQRLGQFDRALAVQRRALEQQERRGQREVFVQALGEMGNLYLLQNDGRSAEPHLKRAYDEAIKANLLSEAALWASNLAEAHMMQGHWDDAQRYNDESIRLKKVVGNPRVVFNVQVAAGIAQGRGQLGEARALYEQMLQDRAANPNERWGAHAGLARVALKGGQASEAARQFEAALDIIEKTRSDLLKTDYKLSYLTSLISFYRDYVDALIVEGRVERALEIADSSRGQVLAERQHVTAPARVNIAATRRIAKDTGSVFLSYWLTRSTSYLWVIDASGVKLHKLPAATEIEPLVRDHQQAIQNALSDLLASRESAGDRLYQMILAPASLRPGARVVVVPDGALHGINLETLPVEGSRRHYLIEDLELQVAPSLASLATPPVSARRATTALVVGDPLPRPPDYPTLKFASAEMSSIAKRFGDAATVIRRDAATPAAYRDAHPERFGFVHFAAHATANVESPLDSAVILSGPDTSYKLYARDVAAQTLTADLVTVSACRSAGEKAYSGEGLIGFAWAFLRAGARRVVAGLWDVDDRTTAQLMEGMYDRVAGGQPPARALREAKLALVRQKGRPASPYAWGAFELFTVAP